jgi:hypothetical protein
VGALSVERRASSVELRASSFERDVVVRIGEVETETEAETESVKACG